MDISNHSPISSHRRMHGLGRTPSLETPLPPSSMRSSRREARLHASPEPWRQDEEISGTALALERSLRLDDAWSSSSSDSGERNPRQHSENGERGMYSSDSPEVPPSGGASLSQEAGRSQEEGGRAQEADPSPRERPAGMSRPATPSLVSLSPSLSASLSHTHSRSLSLSLSLSLYLALFLSLWLRQEGTWRRRSADPQPSTLNPHHSTLNTQQGERRRSVAARDPAGAGAAAAPLPTRYTLPISSRNTYNL